MKSLIVHYLKNLISLWLLASVFPLFTPSDASTLLFASLNLTLLNLLIRPILKLLLLPLNLITFKLFSWLPTVFTLYLTTLLTPNFRIPPLTISHYDLHLIHTPSLHFGSFSSLILVSFLLYLLTRLLSSLSIKEE